MGNTKQRMSWQKTICACPLCGKPVFAIYVYEVRDDGGDVPVLELTGVSTMSHCCGDGLPVSR